MGDAAATGSIQPRTPAFCSRNPSGPSATSGTSPAHTPDHLEAPCARAGQPRSLNPRTPRTAEPTRSPRPRPTCHTIAATPLIERRPESARDTRTTAGAPPPRHRRPLARSLSGMTPCMPIIAVLPGHSATTRDPNAERSIANRCPIAKPHPAALRTTEQDSNRNYTRISRSASVRFVFSQSPRNQRGLRRLGRGSRTSGPPPKPRPVPVDQPLQFENRRLRTHRRR